MHHRVWFRRNRVTLRLMIHLGGIRSVSRHLLYTAPAQVNIPDQCEILFSIEVNVTFVSDYETQGRAPKTVTFLACFAGLLISDHVLLRFCFKRIRNGSQVDQVFAYSTLLTVLLLAPIDRQASFC